ncbi:hypothetical protein SAY86_017242 [Trapa natans]|uniref:Trichome birefringence-like N-terminal domain-containing protein n=1 Tax=Trapa natans TaxID=22666 RepID=A0AAN7M165_TRANT|nr:hypothetical protein SAY86_017242 [Trapa natans]
MEPMGLLSESFRKRRVGSPFCLGGAASLIFVGVFFLASIKSPKLSSFLQIPTVGGWPFPFSASPSSYTYLSPSPPSSPLSVKSPQFEIVNRTQEQKVSVVANVNETGPHLEAKGEEIVPEKNNTPLQDPAYFLRNESSLVREGSLLNGSREGNDSREGSIVSSSVGNNGSDSLASSPTSQDNSSVQAGGEEDKPTRRGPNLGKEGNMEGCDIFDGSWVRDDLKPRYSAGSCPYIDRDFNCHLNGRPDEEFVKWRWKPNACEIPRLNSTDFLEKLRGKRLVFVGDSLNRNMWESLVCILRDSLRNKKRVFEISGRSEFKKKGFYAFRFEDYNCSVDFVSSPFIVRESTFRGSNGSFETLRLDLMDTTTSMYHGADIIVFNTGHWWTHEKTSKGEDYYQEGNYVHPRLKVLEAYKRALNTWAKWVDNNININRSQVLFRGYSVTHFRGGQWNSGGQCHKESEPIFNQKYLGRYPSKMKVLENILHGMKTPVTYLNISRLTAYRKDAHPSIYRMVYNTEEERVAAERAQDCSHWCLPGVPDTWNELLYASILQSHRDS